MGSRVSKTTQYAHSTLPNSKYVYVSAATAPVTGSLLPRPEQKLESVWASEFDQSHSRPAKLNTSTITIARPENVGPKPDANAQLDEANRCSQMWFCCSCGDGPCASWIRECGQCLHVPCASCSTEIQTTTSSSRTRGHSQPTTQMPAKQSFVTNIRMPHQTGEIWECFECGTGNVYE